MPKQTINGEVWVSNEVLSTLLANDPLMRELSIEFNEPVPNMGYEDELRPFRRPSKEIDYD